MTTDGQGIRVRKNRQQSEAVRLRIVDAGIRLFLANGYEATSVDAIAEAAGVSRRSVFRYFATKEDIVLAWASETGPALLERLDPSLVRHDPMGAARNAILAHVAANDMIHGLSLTVGELIERTPALKARAHEKYLVWEELLSDGLMAHGAEEITARMASAMAVAGLRIAVRSWIESSGRPPIEGLIVRAYALV